MSGLWENGQWLGVCIKHNPKFSLRECAKCHRQYTYWKEKGLFNSKKFCPDCYISHKSKDISGLPLENISGKERSLDKIWADKQTVNLLMKLAGLTVKQKAAVNKFMADNKVPDSKSSYYEAIRKMRKAGKILFR